MKSKIIFQGLLLMMTMVGCSKSKSIPNDHGAISALENKTFFESIGAVKPVDSYSVYAESMKTCIYADEDEKSCPIVNLPLIGMSKKVITIDDIMKRTLVSHDFMAISFREVLLRLPSEVLQMFGAVNAIVISDKINPSFYLTSSGSIYLSGSYFWHNYEDWSSMSHPKDSREAFGSALQFVSDHDYIKNKKSISSRADEYVKSYDEMVLPLARLLFHELTHANDWYPKAFYTNDNFDQSKTFQETAFDRYVKLKIASANQPTKLSSLKLTHLGQVMYRGEVATAEDKKFLATEIAEMFKNDIASDFYSYSSTREDLAMSAEESMMLYYYDAYRYVVVIKFPYSGFIVPANYAYPIVWGQKGRVLLPAIKERALYAIENNLGPEIKEKARAKFLSLKTTEIPANTPWDMLDAI